MHWWTKVFYEAGDLRSLTSLCLTKVNTMVNTISTSAFATFKEADKTTPLTEVKVDECLAELLYLKRQIDTKIQYRDAERALRLFQDGILSKPANAENFLITKYYVKLLQEYDEYQLGTEAKAGYSQLLEAQKLNQEVLIKLHKHRKETIRIQLTRI